jgi:preprotein translocase subunit YajC
MDFSQISPAVPGLIMLLVVTAIFWFVVIRPTKKSQHQHQDLVENLTPGDRIISVGGIYGTVRRVREKSIELEIADGVVMTLDRRAARRLQENA